ncbi:MAG: P-loop NTPase fold protein [Paludibacteraceae bacterium]|nr:P-loop NTPase fold protein [Paludibacteraceae bacterium]
MEINVDKELKAFKQYLEINTRAILSAKFGDGKTYFLEKFKKQYGTDSGNKTYKSNKFQDGRDYTEKIIASSYGDSHETETNGLFITIHPVNYSIAKNADIFEYIKRDILIELSKHDELNAINYEQLFKTITIYDKNFLNDLVHIASRYMPRGKMFEGIMKLKTDVLDKYRNQDSLIQYYNEFFIHQTGGLYEDDEYTKMINFTLKEIEGKNKYLIIEDLDRLDPAHLFRILNVLGAHIDSDKQHNKFGFDNIILVMDYDVTRGIFEHFYGKTANYDGYMAKFLTSHPYYYSITKIAQKALIDKLEEEFRLPTSIFNVTYANNSNGKEHSLYSTISHLSVREIKMIEEKITREIIQHEIYIVKGAKDKISRVFLDAHTPLAIYLAVLNLCKVHIDFELLENNLHKMGAEYIDALGTYLFKYVWQHNNDWFQINETLYIKLKIAKNDSKINNISTRTEKYTKEQIAPVHNINNDLKLAFYDTVNNIMNLATKGLDYTN